MKVNFNRIIIPSSNDNILNLLTKFIQCKICLNLLNDPYDCLCCNQTFCKSCIINYIQANNKCPFSEFFSNQQDKKYNTNNNINDLMKKIKPSSSNFTKVIQSLKFYCQNKEKGCNAELNIEEIFEHEKICKFNNNRNNDNINNSSKKQIKKNENEIQRKNKNNNTNVNKSRNSNVKCDKDMVKKKESKEGEWEGQRKNVIHHTFKDSLNYQNNIPLKQQDSIMSFCDFKNSLDEKEINTERSSGNKENESSIKNNTLNVKNFEKSIEEINQKLSNINKYITNNLELKLIEENYSKSNNSNLDKNSEKETSEYNISENDKGYKSNSMAITNNYYDGSYINTINNFSNQSINKSDYLDMVKTSTKKIPKYKMSPLNLKSNKAQENSNKINNYKKYLKYKKNTIPTMMKKDSTKKSRAKNTNILSEFNNKEEIKILNETKTDKVLRKNSINCTPKLGSKSHKKIIDTKNLNTSAEINNNIHAQTERHSSLEDISISIKHLENKMNYIEKLLQSNNCLINQEYSIQNEEKNEKIEKINLNKNMEDKLNEEKIKKLFDELMNKKENNFKNMLNEQVESIKKYISEQCIEEMRKSVIETNMDIMTLYHDKLDELEKVINKYYETKDNLK